MIGAAHGAEFYSTKYNQYFPLRATYRLSFENIWEKIDRFIRSPHCTFWWSLMVWRHCLQQWRWGRLIRMCPWTSYKIRKITGCACSRNVGNIFPTTDFKGNHWLMIPACITARAMMHVGITNTRWWGKHSRRSRRMHNPQIYIYGKRPMHRTPSNGQPLMPLLTT